jgi:hypothetical protein
MSQVITVAEIEAALSAVLPERLHAYTAAVARVLADLANGIIPPLEAEARVASEPHAGRLLRDLAGQTIGTAASTISFGADNELGDVTIRDVAGRDIVHLTINLVPALPPGQAGSKPHPKAERMPGAIPGAEREPESQQPGSRGRNSPDEPVTRIEDEIRTVLRPLMGDRDSRRGRLTRAFGAYPGLLDRLNLDGETGVFLSLLLHTLRDYGEVERGLLAVAVLLESVKGEVGAGDRERIEEILRALPR